MRDDQPYLYLTTTGWKTGNSHEIEIWFIEYAGRFYLCAEKRTNAHWVTKHSAQFSGFFSYRGNHFQRARANRGRERKPAAESSTRTIRLQIPME